MRLARRIKIVPKADPNADGEWIDLAVPVVLPDGNSWSQAQYAINCSGVIPDDYFVVSYDSEGEKAKVMR